MFTEPRECHNGRSYNATRNSHSNKQSLPTQCRRAVPLIFNEQLYSSASDREKKTNKKTIYNKHQNTMDMQDYLEVTRNWEFKNYLGYNLWLWKPDFCIFNGGLTRETRLCTHQTFDIAYSIKSQQEQKQWRHQSEFSAWRQSMLFRPCLREYS